MGRLSSKDFINSHKALVTRCINEYLDSHLYDYTYFATTRDYITVKNVPQLLEFAYNNLPLETYKKLQNKAAPFEPSLDCDDYLEKERMKQKIAKLAEDIRYNKANLIELIDLGITDVKQYVYMIKLLAYEYKMVSASIFMSNFSYAESIEKYNQDVDDSTVEFSDLTPQLENAMMETLKSRNLKVNSITLSAAHSYCKRKLQSDKTR